LSGCGSSGSNDQNEPPEIERIETDTEDISTRQRVFVNVLATDPEGDELEYSWSSNGGKILTGGASDVPDYSPTTNPARWRAPEDPGEYKVTCVVSDGIETDEKSITVEVN
jgi:hypothetical protein